MIHPIFVLIFFFLVGTILVFQPKAHPFQLTEDMTAPKGYEKRLEVSPHELVYRSSIRYTQQTTNLLSERTDKELMGIRCSDSFVRNGQGVYILENARAKLRYRKTVKNEAFIEYMREKERTLPVGKKILSARVCETQAKEILLFYSIGEYENTDVNSSPAGLVIAYSTQNTAFVEILRKNIFGNPQTVVIGKSKDHIRCDEPFQISKKGELLILCSETRDWQSNHFTYQVYLEKEVSAAVEECRNHFGEKSVKTLCKTN